MGLAGIDALRTVETAETELPSVLRSNSDPLLIDRLTLCKMTAGEDRAALFRSFFDEFESVEDTCVILVGDVLEETRVSLEAEEVFPEETEGTWDGVSTDGVVYGKSVGTYCG